MQGRNYFEDFGVYARIILKRIRGEQVLGMAAEFFRLVEVPCEHGNEPSSLTKFGNLLIC